MNSDAARLVARFGVRRRGSDLGGIFVHFKREDSLRTSEVMVGGGGRRGQGPVISSAQHDVIIPPAPSRRRRESDEDNEEVRQGGRRGRARRDTRESARRSRSLSRDVAAPPVSQLDLQSALAYVEQHLPGLNALITGRGRGRGRPRGRAASVRGTRAGPRRGSGRSGIGYEEVEEEL